MLYSFYLHNPLVSGLPEDSVRTFYSRAYNTTLEEDLPLLSTLHSQGRLRSAGKEHTLERQPVFDTQHHLHTAAPLPAAGLQSSQSGGILAVLGCDCQCSCDSRWGAGAGAARFELPHIARLSLRNKLLESWELHYGADTS